MPPLLKSICRISPTIPLPEPPLEPKMFPMPPVRCPRRSSMLLLFLRPSSFMYILFFGEGSVSFPLDIYSKM